MPTSRPGDLVPPTLVIIRGNSGSGKTSAAREARRRYGRGAALLEQDYLRRTLLREHDTAHINPVAPAFITATARTALDLGYHVILEGILHTERYADALHHLIDHHPGPTAVFYLDVSYDETVRRHLTRAEPIPVTPDEMRHWYTHRDLLHTPTETVIPETSTLDQTVATILRDSGLTTAVPRTPCPQRCQHCSREADNSHRPLRSPTGAPPPTEARPPATDPARVTLP
ncbi:MULTISPECIES: AAA family ATPase [unclassified Micromonospora]|uniref:AAA family ATPase n=1 Tax=unclassified Micromonospora TaxID=2617518 RepID=UPI0024178D49|nr:MULTISPECIES: AAA family ATPase [unclassified Micromonospora]MDG4817027.1 AAA family ATPase [Micromonospora sp. WMMD956]WFE59605.1 AAA family ATPase [Micromonospora sp. WMMD712]